MISGWPERTSQVDPELPEYWNIKEEISVCDDSLLRNDKLIVPSSLREEMLSQIDSSRGGVYVELLFWPRMNQQIADIVSKCNTCNMCRKSQAKEPLKFHELAERPWEKIAVDLFELEKQEFVVMVDYYSKFFEVQYCAKVMQAKCANFVLCSRDFSTKVRMKFHGVSSDNSLEQRAIFL